MPEALAELQGWMMDGILAGGAEGIPQRIEGDARLDPQARFAIYAGGYRSRLRETLRDDYPALRLLVGETVFDLFAQGYIEARPPGHFSLYDYGAGFAGYLEATRPADGGQLAALPAQVARLERARAGVQRAVGVERLVSTALTADSAITPGLRLKLPDSVRLLALEFDLAPLIEACGRGEKAAVPEPRRSLIAVARSAYRLRQHELERWHHAFLEALGSEGAVVHVAASAAARACGRDGGALLADLMLWLPAAAASGLVVAS